MKRRTLIAGNWKMNGTRQAAVALAESVARSAGEARASVELALCPPFVHLEAVGGALSGAGVELGAQDVSRHPHDGACTGEISAPMLADMGCRYVIVGHSERRQYHGETDEIIAAKAAQAMECGVIPIICVGETLDQRQAGQTAAVIESQVGAAVPSPAAGGDLVVAYEPVWAIGTGLTASAAQIEDVHAQIRALLEKRLAEPAHLRIIYGGSVKPENAGEILSLANVDGALVGGASLKAETFLAIAQAAKD